MSEERFPKFLLSFPGYLDTIEELRPVKRPVLLWSAVSLIYVFGGLQLSDNTDNTSVSLRGFQIIGLTDTKLTIFFILATLYYTVRWLWTTLRIRTYIDDGFMCMLWQYGNPQSLNEKKDGREGYGLRKEYEDAQGQKPFESGSH